VQNNSIKFPGQKEIKKERRKDITANMKSTAAIKECKETGNEKKNSTQGSTYVNSVMM
jgi:hypothetical protein